MSSRSRPSLDSVLVRSLDMGGTGPRIAVKDCIDIGGYSTGCGSAAFADAPPAIRNAEVVDILLEAGCRIVGKANMHELAYGVTGENAFTGTPVNPAFPDRIVGGSSSGSAAAVAAGLVDFAIGTDTGGSIRMPAACCGIAGLKPTFGAISREGAIPAQSSLDCIGPLALDMTAIVQAAGMILPGFLPQTVTGTPRFCRLQVSADADVAAALDAVLARSGADMTMVDLPLFEAAFLAGITIMGAEMADLFGNLCGTGKLGADVDARIAAAKSIDAEQVRKAEEVRERFTAQVDAALETCDALVLPTLPAVPLKLDEASDARAALRLTALVRPFNVSGHPALTVPTRTSEGLPAGVQLVGRKGDEAALCAIGQWLEPSL